MPNRSKQKGARFELEIVGLLQAGGLDAEKVPLSGAIKGGSFEGDIDCLVRGVKRKLECKRRKRGCTTYYGFMEGNYAVVMRDDRTPPLIMLRLDDFIELVRA
jgi:hypothetical protein